MTVGVKYCGGCNEYYSRITAVEHITHNQKTHAFEPYEQGKCYDKVLVVCGCPSVCVKTQGDNVVYMCSLEDAERIAEEL